MLFLNYIDMNYYAVRPKLNIGSTFCLSYNSTSLLSIWMKYHTYIFVTVFDIIQLPFMLLKKYFYDLTMFFQLNQLSKSRIVVLNIYHKYLGCVVATLTTWS